ncbi:hypothetical protein Y1Q_0021474 [Alligator mississippiensis]|uniref:SAP domain-containing protein n=1 Tax=Alligator mississippiensis TaxID=8496 RepID=A0A151P9S9_ALLMI|nr:hypothetical protein Y1Q_0021474 [Alligator mississippiensis]
MADEYVWMTVPELKELAKERGLHATGRLKKDELIKLLCTGESGTASASHSSSPELDPGPHSRSSSPEAARRSPSEREQQRLHEIELKRMEWEEKKEQQRLEKEQLAVKRMELEAQWEEKQQQLEDRRMEREARLEAQKMELEQKKLEAQLRLRTNGGNANPPQASREQLKLDVSAFARY